MVGRVSLPSGTRFNLRYPSWIQFTLPILLEHTCIYKIIYDCYHKLYIYIHILYTHSVLKKNNDTNSPQFTIPQQMWGQKSPCCFVVSPGKIPTPPWPSTELDRHWPLTHDSWHRGRWRLTWNLQITHLERKMIFQTSMIMFHVNLQDLVANWDDPPSFTDSKTCSQHREPSKSSMPSTNQCG